MDSEKSERESTSIDPVTLEVLWSQLRTIPEEMGEYFTRTAFSQVIKHGHDLSTAIFTPDGRLLAQGVYTAGHLGSMPFAMQEILENHFPPEEWNSGDVVITNDPHINSGHLNDIFMFEPVIYNGEISGFCVTTAHHLDVGGAAPGSYPIEVVDMYGEGLQLPPVKLYESGNINQEVMDIITENSRMSTNIRGDVRAQRASTKIGTQRLLDLINEYGVTTINEYSSEIIDRTEQSIRSNLESLPNGSYYFEDKLDGFEEPLPICVEITIDDDTLTVDFEGTASQLENYSINSTWNYTFAYTMLAIKTIIDPDTPQTHGTIIPITMNAPDESLVNPSPPVPVAAHGVLADYIQSTINGALHQVVPGQVPAAAGPSLRLLLKYRDQDKVQYDGYTGGTGARSNQDGHPAVATSSNIQNTPVEAIEAEYPVLINEYQMVQDTAGAGKYRGGSSTVREYEFLSPCEIQLIAERFKYAPYGLEGGEKGAKGKGILNPDSQGGTDLPSKASLTVGDGDILRIFTCGGGGYGEPEERDIETIEHDVANGVVSKDYAESHHGYVPSNES